MLEIPNFGHMDTCGLNVESRDKLSRWRLDIDYDAITIILKRRRVANFADIIKIQIMLIRTIFKLKTPK